VGRGGGGVSEGVTHNYTITTVAFIGLHTDTGVAYWGATLQYMTASLSGCSCVKQFYNNGAAV